MNKKELDVKEKKIWAELSKVLELEKLSKEKRDKSLGLLNDYIEISKLQDSLED